MELAYVIPPVCIHVVRWCAVLPRFCRVTSGTLPVAALQRRPVDANKAKFAQRSLTSSLNLQTTSTTTLSNMR